MTLTSAFVQSIGLIEPKRKCILLCLSLPSALWWCFAWQLVFYCGEKKGLLTRFLRPYFAHSNLHGPFAFWMTGCTALTQSHYGHSHISNTFASQHCTLAHVNCVKLLVYQPLSPKVFLFIFFVTLLHVSRNVWHCSLVSLTTTFELAFDKTVCTALQGWEFTAVALQTCWR